MKDKPTVMLISTDDNEWDLQGAELDGHISLDTEGLMADGEYILDIFKRNIDDIAAAHVASESFLLFEEALQEFLARDMEVSLGKRNSLGKAINNALGEEAVKVG